MQLDPEKGGDLTEEPDLPCSVGGSPVEAWVSSGSPPCGHLARGRRPWCKSLLGVAINSTVEPVGPRAVLKVKVKVSLSRVNFHTP